MFCMFVDSLFMFFDVCVWLRPIASSLFSPPLRAGAQTLLGTQTCASAHTPGGLKSMDFLPPQCGSASPSHRAPSHRAPSHRHGVARLAPQCGSASPSPRTVAPPNRVFHEAASCRRSCLVRDLVESHGLGRSQPTVRFGGKPSPVGWGCSPWQCTAMVSEK